MATCRSARPATTDKTLAARVDVFVVDVTEVDPPPGVEPLHWRLLTTHEVTTVAKAQVTEARRFVKLGVVAFIAAVRIMQIAIGRDGKTEQVLADAIEPALTALNGKLEGRTDKVQNPTWRGVWSGSRGS